MSLVPLSYGVAEATRETCTYSPPQVLMQTTIIMSNTGTAYVVCREALRQRHRNNTFNGYKADTEIRVQNVYFISRHIYRVTKFAFGIAHM